MTGYTMGVDLGTTFTAAATIDVADVPVMVGLGNRAMQIPSVLHVSADGVLSVGEHAERRATTEPGGVIREFKRRIGDPTPIVLAGRRFHPDRLTAQLLQWVVATTTERMGSPPSQITVTHPATWTTFTITKLTAAADELGDLPPVTPCPEPVAAAHHYAVHHAVQPGDRICIYDLGGGTFDVCVVEQTGKGFEIIGKPTGIAYLGGIDFDQLVMGAVVDGLMAAHPDLDLDDPGFTDLRRACVEAKEALSAEVDAVIPVKVAGLNTVYRLTRREFEAMIDSAIESTVAVTRDALVAAGVSAGELSAMVLVGGSSRIPLVSEKLAQAFQCPIAIDTHPQHEVALGAALAGRRQSAAEQRSESVISIERRPSRRRRAALSAVGAVAAVAVAGVVVARSWLLPSVSAEPNSPVGQPQSTAAAGTSTAAKGTGGTVGSTEPVASDSSPPSTSAPSDAPDSGPSTSTGSPWSGTASQAAAIPLAPDTLDAATVGWFQTLCGGGSRLNQEKPDQHAIYPSLAAAQRAYSDSYAARAAIAQSTADSLSRSTTGPIAGGRVDADSAINGLRELGRTLSDARSTIAAANVTTAAELRAADDDVVDSIAQRYRPVDVQLLAADELAFIGQLPGCERLAGD